MPYLGDRVRETSTTTGTGTISLGGAVSQFVSFATVLGSSSSVVPYLIVGQTTTEWEYGYGTFNGTTSLTRDVIKASSNSNAAVNFSSGTKDVSINMGANLLKASILGQQLAQSRGWALP